MASKIACDNCDRDVIVNGKQTMLYYEYDALPFSIVAQTPGRRTVICAECDDRLRKQNGLTTRGARGRLA